jgi:hypothetical protein
MELTFLQTPREPDFWQVAVWVHFKPSEQLVPFLALSSTFLQFPVELSHIPLLQASPEQVIVVPEQVPELLHWSFLVHF